MFNVILERNYAITDVNMANIILLNLANKGVNLIIP